MMPKCYRIAQRYITADGVEHKSEKDAEAHIKEVICTEISNVLRSAIAEAAEGTMSNMLTMRDLVPLTEALYENRKPIMNALLMEIAFDEGD